MWVGNKGMVFLDTRSVVPWFPVRLLTKKKAQEMNAAFA